MRTVCLLAAFAAASAAVHPFYVQQYERDLQQQLYREDRRQAGLAAGPAPEFFTQYQDHFDGTNAKEWQQAFYTNATFWKGPASGAPVFLCVGGEGPAIDGTAVSGSVHCNVAVEWLQETGALMFAVEHRYYGCHNASACPVENVFALNALKYLSSRQALGDLAKFHAYATERYNLTAANKWVTWGGSYPGMLAGWARLKYPHLFHASVASSAPVRAELNMQGYNNVVAAAYGVSDNNVGGSPACTANIKDGHAKIGEMFTTDAGRQTLASLWGHDAAWYNVTANQKAFAGNGVAQFPAQSNDPSCTRSGCNIKKICEIMVNGTGDNVERLSQVTKSQDLWATRKWELTAPALENNYWGYQTCTEFAFYQTCDVGSECFYTQGYVTTESMDSFCSIEFGVPESLIQRNVDYTNEYYGGDKPAGSCVFYPNGEVDPWHANSVLVSPTPGIPILSVPGASHHAWTHPSEPNDQASVVAARQTIRQQVKTFLSQDCLQSQ